ncbi:hypothetical protein AXG93_146s1450 [Marchantia polymorpha subsp. ruderalis]|uniref:tyrosine--tRNA ligase n=1 Tax=Marchantia polymorpha subsp. ruderalis TaxID=1480154 RepID=A0A176W7M9_MARPO|nr:hypothetical protein AXG93_146s1450 [Marchantia polymorpha subsp. ruderalis]
MASASEETKPPVEAVMPDTAPSSSQADDVPDDHFSKMTLDEKYALVRSIGEECIQEEELRNLLEKKKDPVAYDGFEPSGRMHIAQGVMKVINVNKLTKAGCIFKFWVADWFAQLNNKMGGDLKKIQTVGRYMIEIWKAVGMNMDRVQILWTSEEINARPDEYWPLVMDIARRNNLSRIKRCSQIMGRNDEDELTAAQIFYPCMQCADIFFLKADICQLGMDQRKSEVKSKINKAWCPALITDGNPLIEYTIYIVLPYFNEFVVDRKEEHGGAKTYKTAEELKEDYTSGALHPGDLKVALIKAINRILEPVREHFKTNAEAKDLLKKVKFIDIWMKAPAVSRDKAWKE